MRSCRRQLLRRATDLSDSRYCAAVIAAGRINAQTENPPALAVGSVKERGA